VTVTETLPAPTRTPAQTRVPASTRVPGPDRYDCAKPCRSCVRARRNETLRRVDHHFAVSGRRRLIALGVVALGVVGVLAVHLARRGRRA
jgi:hypothetical protein